MTENLRERLAAPFPADAIGWKPQTVKNNRALAVAFIDARDVMNRLDEVVGCEGWWATYDLVGDGQRVVCHLTLRVDAVPVTKTDVGGESEQSDAGDRLKAAFSDALKRAAVQWGVGRYLYSLPAVWCDVNEYKQIVKPPTLPAWALPVKQETPAAPEKAKQPADPRFAPLMAAKKAADWSWEQCMIWLASAYPQDAGRYTADARFSGLEPERVDHLTRHLNTLAVQKVG